MPSPCRASRRRVPRRPIVGRFGARSRVREGEVAEVAVDTRTLHFFDPETGLGIYEQPRKKEAA